MECNPDAVVLGYVEPEYRDYAPPWLIEQGFRGKMGNSVSVGSSTLPTRMDRSQFIPNDLVQEAQWLATQEMNFGFLPRVMAAVKLSAKSNLYRIDRSLVREIQRVGDFDLSNLGQGFSLSQRASSATLLGTEPLPTDIRNVAILAEIPRRAKNVLSNVNPETFLSSEYFEVFLSNSSLTPKMISN
jgi:hypothetical protein